jgi:hypothetical protein
MPAWDAIVKSGIHFGQLSKSKGEDRGPTICMTVADHSKTASYKGHPLSKKGRYRDAQSLVSRIFRQRFTVMFSTIALNHQEEHG